MLVRFCLLILIGTLASTGLYASPNNIEGIQVYQKNVHLFPERKQKVADDISRYHNADNLWDVLRDEFTLPHYENNPLVQEKIEWFMNNQDFLLRSATRAAPYLYYISQQVKKRHLPAELVLLPIIESGYNPFSLSHAGAAGVWQLMPQTATGLGVKQDWWYDGRRDVIASTRAALNYLAYLQSFFDGNWLLAIAAYNTGEGNVLSAIKRNIRSGLDTDFWSLPVAQETRDYVPSLLALAIIISHPDQYPIYFPPVRNAPYLAQVDLETQISLKEAASLAGISYKKMVQLNPGFSQSVTVAKRGNKLVLPIENVVEFTENLSTSPLNHRQVNWMHYKVKSGDTIASIASKFKTTPAAIRSLNHLSKNSVRRNNNLLIPKTSLSLDTNPVVADNHVSTQRVKKGTSKLAKAIASAANQTAGSYILQPGDTIYMTRKKDTLESIAKRFHITKTAIQAANNLRGRSITPGKQLLLPTHKGIVTSQNTNSTNKLSPGDTIYMVRRGDTIDKIARRFHTTSASIRIANLVDDSTLQEGLKIIVPTHVRT
jgi:membrane-bound lytic murein transglycosylase D